MWAGWIVKVDFLFGNNYIMSVFCWELPWPPAIFHQGESSKENESPECPPAGILKPTSGPPSSIRPLQKTISFGDVWVQHPKAVARPCTVHSLSSAWPGALLIHIHLSSLMKAALAGSFVSISAQYACLNKCNVQTEEHLFWSKVMNFKHTVCVCLYKSIMKWMGDIISLLVLRYINKHITAVVPHQACQPV